MKTLLADSGYASEDNVDACAKAKIRPLIALSRQRHHPSLRERFNDPPPLQGKATPLETMRHRLKTRRGRKLYRLAQVHGGTGVRLDQAGYEIRQFSLRGITGARGEWSLVCLAWDLKRMNVLLA